MDSPTPNHEQGDTPALTPEYYKARRQLILWSSVLFGWELVGVDLEKLDTGAGNVGAIAKALKSPQAVPWVIVVLVAFFAYRITVEWKQSNHARRSRVASQVDIVMSIGIAFTSYLLFFGQRAAGVQLADILTWKTAAGFISITGLGSLYFYLRSKIIWRVARYEGSKLLLQVARMRAIADGVALVILGICSLGLLSWLPSLWIGAGGLAGLFGLIVFFAGDQWRIRRLAKRKIEHEAAQEQERVGHRDV
jgi:hypothetical protein